MISKGEYQESVFNGEYNKLNELQKKAVDHIEGPVMVIAGPGTGKTQILATRIANILLKTQVSPYQILCLTYTDAGVKAMKERLSRIIGSSAYDVSVFTFHAFCNRVISDSPEQFGLMDEHSLLEELEQYEIIESLLKNLPSDNPLYSLRDDYKSNIKGLKNFFNDIKKENWNISLLEDTLKRTIVDLKFDESLYYKRKYKDKNPGDLNEAKYNEKKKKFERSLAAVQLFIKYQNKLTQLNKYTYEDLIQWVINRLSINENFLANYQEKYQYILVDEFQDTNGSQMEIIKLLSSYWEKPNLFVVGDDDQAIYRFQGANMMNMFNFLKTYNPEVIILKKNYRSSQNILNASKACIENNTERLVNILPGFDKEFISSGINSQWDTQPKITKFSDPISEVILITDSIRKYLENNTNAISETAILFRNNRDAIPFTKLFESKGIPYFLSKDVNCLAEPIIQAIIDIIKYIIEEKKSPFSAENILVRILYFPFFNIATLDLAMLMWSIQNSENIINTNQNNGNKLFLRSMINDEKILVNLNLIQYQHILNFSNNLENLFKEVELCTPQIFIEKILYNLGIVNYIIEHKDSINQLQIVNSFFTFIKELYVTKPNMDLSSLLSIFERMNKYGLTIKAQLYSGISNGIYLSTLHSAKGLEFDTVYLINQTESGWATRGGRGFLLPDTYIKTESDSEEDDRRLFYVGMTRAKRFLNISYSVKSKNKKENNPIRFIQELNPEGRISISEEACSEFQYNEFIKTQHIPSTRTFELISSEFYRKFLDKFEISATSLNKYLECPLKFYHEIVLRAPGARNSIMGFGNAVHYTLEKFYKDSIRSEKPDIELLLQYFAVGLKKYRSHFTETEFEKYLKDGSVLINEFVQNNFTPLSNVESLITEYQFKNVNISGVPITGKLDRIDIYKNGSRVIDYKTGNSNHAAEQTKHPNEKLKHGGEYWRQMVFYKMLMESESKKFGQFLGGSFNYIVRDKRNQYVEIHLSPDEGDVQFLTSLIKDVYDKIKRAEFTPGCGDSKCSWCNYYSKPSKEIDTNFLMESAEDEL